MDQESAREAHGRTVPKGPSGLRRLSPAMLETDKLARGFGPGTGADAGPGREPVSTIKVTFSAVTCHAWSSRRRLCGNAVWHHPA